LIRVWVNASAFRRTVRRQLTAYTDVFTGKISDDDAIAGTIAVAGVEGTFTAKKQKARSKE
jgi:hypothetical protein